MVMDLTPETRRRVALLFREGEQPQVEELLVSRCGDNLPFAKTMGTEGVERIRFAVLRISGGSLERLDAAIRMAESDWRDVLVGAGFGEDETVHHSWVPEPRRVDSTARRTH